MFVGAHESAAGGPHTAIERAVADGCEAVQLFTKNNNRWEQRQWTDEEAAKFRKVASEADIPLVAHAAYLINLCSATEAVREKSIRGLADELSRCQQLGIPMLVFHPGAPGAKRSDETGIDQIAENLDRLFDEHGERFKDVMPLLENTAGQGSNLGWRFEHLRDILAKTKYAGRLGICYDTCHAFAAGYDYSTREKYDAHWAEFHEVIGLPRLKAFHLNDSKKELGSRVDRHDHPGDGLIGPEPFRWLINDARFQNIPGCLETPPMDEESDSGYAENVAILKAMRSSGTS